MRVATWNVLHRIHAVNWRELVIERHPDEATRIAAITARVAGLGDVVCLQEVSGDQLASFRAGIQATILSHPYPRVPKLFRPGPPQLTDPSEHLVTISMLPVAKHHSCTFPADKGKGYLVVELDSGAAVINTHVSYGAHHPAQCSMLRSEASAYRLAVVLGDFNDDLDACIAELGPELFAAIPAKPALPTRPRTNPSTKSQTIDHIFVRDGRVEAAEVLSGSGLSDHNPVVATVR